MNKVARMILQDKMSRRDKSSSQSDGRDYAAGYRDGFNDRASYEIKGEYDRNDHNDYNDMARRRSKRTGRYISDRHGLRLSESEIYDWEKMLVNADGTHGKHFDMHHAEEAASKLGIRFDRYSEHEFCMAMNMLYSDLCEVCRSSVSPEKEAMHYAKMAQAWLEDDDGPEPAEKLALYYYCIVDDE